MSDLKALFEQAQKDVKTLTKKPSNEDLLTLYSLFKQGASGDVSGARPGMLDMVGRGRYVERVRAPLVPLFLYLICF